MTVSSAGPPWSPFAPLPATASAPRPHAAPFATAPGGALAAPREVGVVLLEDDPRDAERTVEALRAEGLRCVATRVERLADLEAMLARGVVDLVLADFALPGCDGPAALETAQRLAPDIPFLFVAEPIGEEAALETLRRGATDYVLKTRLDALGPAVRRALAEAAEKRARRRAVARLHALQSLATALAAAPTSRAIAEVGTREIVESTGARAGACWLLAEGDPDTLALEAVAGAESARLVPVGAVRVADPLSPIAQVARTGAPFWLSPGAAGRAPLAGVARDDDAAACVPLAVAERVVGVIALGFASPRAPGDQDRDLLLALARQCNHALERARLMEQAREADRRYRFLAEAIPQVVWTATPDGEIDYYNRRGADYLGQPQASPDRWGWIDAVHPDDRPETLSRWSASLRTGVPFEMEYRVRRADGVYRWHLARAIAETDAAGRVRKWFGTATDIDDKKRAEAEAARLLELSQLARGEAEAANSAKDEFLATISHELRTPLTAILGWTRMMRTGVVSAERREHALATIERNAAAQVRLVEDLLDISRIVSGRVELSREPLDLRAVGEAALDAVRLMAEARGVALEFDCAPEVSGAGLVVGDAVRLQQCVWNLLANGVKFTPRGGRVALRVVRSPSRGYELCVRDTGEGIPREFLPHVFERFRQADTGTARRHGGLGLGLAIVRHLVELHGGTIAAASEGPGCGASFTIWLPAAPRA